MSDTEGTVEEAPDELDVTGEDPVSADVEVDLSDDDLGPDEIDIG